MARPPRFTDRNVDNAKPGRTFVPGDVTGLYLYVNPEDRRRKRWILRYRKPNKDGSKRPKRVTEMSLGHLPYIDLTMAREHAKWIHGLLARGIDPLEAKKWNKNEGATFAQVADQFIERNKSEWSDSQHNIAKHLLHTHCAPLAKLTLINVTSKAIHEALAPLERRAPQQARRALKMIERVLNFGKANGFPVGENQARWKGHQENLFPRRRRSLNGKHFASMKHQEVPAFVQKLRQRQARATAAVALEVTLLTACRTSEVRGMRWAEVHGNIWTIPAHRMKAREEHRVPLSNRVLELLARQNEYAAGSPFVFTGYFRNQPLAEKSMLRLLKTMNVDVTVHGFRSSFRNWVAENKSTFDFAAAEMCLAHTVGNKNSQAYLTSDLLDKRKEIMDAWAQYLEGV